MAHTMCPGQDTAFWRPGDIYEVPCSVCGEGVEFFKDDATRRCPGCGRLVRNPRLNLGCAQWCEHAKECLGYDPAASRTAAGGDEGSLVERLKRELARGEDGIARLKAALPRLALAEAELGRQGGDPRVVLPAALVGGLEAPAAEEALKAAGLDAATRERVLELLASPAAARVPAQAGRS